MNSHREVNDEEFAKRFHNCEFDPDLFNHEAHLRLAFIHISKSGCANAEKIVVRDSQAFTRHAGVPGKFNKTVTIAAVKAVSHFMAKAPGVDFNSLLLKFPRLLTNFGDLMRQHYSIDILQSSAAKNEYLEPDLLPFA